MRLLQPDEAGFAIKTFVEMPGVEPGSENQTTKTPTFIFYLLISPVMPW